MEDKKITFIDESLPTPPEPDSRETLPPPIEELSKKKSKRIKKPKKQKGKPIEMLKQIYESGGELPDMTKIERAKRRPRIVLIGLLAFFAVLAAAAWAGFFIFKPYARFEGKGLELSVRGPREVRAGEVVEYHFDYRNTERASLASLELRLVIPKEFHILEMSELPTTEPFVWTLGSLGAGADDSITTRGFFLGPGEGTSAFQSIATYRPANFNSDFQAITTHQIALSGTVLDGTLAGPNEIAPGEEGEYVYTVKHTGSEPLENLVFTLEAPESFIVAESEPAASEGNNREWTLQRLEPGSETVIKVRGNFSAAAKGPTEVAVKAGVRRDDTILIHRRDAVSSDVLASDVALDLIVNGSRTHQNADFGSTIRLSLSYQNLGTSALGGVVLSITAASDPANLIDWEHVEASVPGRVSSGTITWTGRELDALASIEGSEEGMIDVTLPTRSAPTGSGADEIRFSGNGLIATVGGRAVNRSLQTTPIIISLNSDLGFTAEARYFDEEAVALGSGPLPPKVGETTNLRVFWNLVNTRHELENVRVRTTLPSRVAWTGRTHTDIGTIGWDESSRTITFTLDRWPTDIGSIGVNFEVAATPNESDVGKFMTLTNEMVLTARDTKTDGALSRTLDGVTSEMPNDPEVRGRGVVVE